MYLYMSIYIQIYMCIYCLLIWDVVHAFDIENCGTIQWSALARTVNVRMYQNLSINIQIYMYENSFCTWADAEKCCGECGTINWWASARTVRYSQQFVARPVGSRQGYYIFMYVCVYVLVYVYVYVCMY